MASSLSLTPGLADELAACYARGAHKREELLFIARKAHQDLVQLARYETVDPHPGELLARILEEADRNDNHFEFEGPGLHQHLDTHAGIDSGQKLQLWAQSMDTILEAVTGLGNHCFVRLKKHRRATSALPALPEPLDYRPLKRKNVLLNNIEMLLGRTVLQSYPHQMEIDPTNDCNLKCRSCQHSLLESFYRAELPADLMYRLRDAFPFVDYLHLYGNGEPMLASSLAAMVDLGHHYQCTVDVLTNGTRLARTDFDFSHVSRLGISFDGAAEATARLLRPPSRVLTILAGIRAVHQQAPHLTIYAKVTISRVNLDELADIVECLAEAGVSEVILHSLRSYHPDQEPLQVRVSDRPFALEQLDKAIEAARRHQVQLVSTITFDDFAVGHDVALRKKDLLVYLESLPLPAQRVPPPAEVAAVLEKVPFSFYPEIFSAALDLPQTVPTRYRPEPERPPVTPQTIDPLIRTLAGEALQSPLSPLPYCFMPFKLPFVDPDGRARICDFLTIFVGDVAEHETFAPVWNSPAYQAIRRAMFDTEQLPRICRECVSDCRGAFAADTVAVADLLQVPIREHPAYPVPVHLATVLERREIELTGSATVSEVEGIPCFHLPPDEQIIVRFPDPQAIAHVYYRGKFRITGGPLLIGIKEWGARDLWNYLLEPADLDVLGPWVGLPMPSLPLDFTSPEQKECCLFLWAPSGNSSTVEVEVSEFEGLAAIPSDVSMDGLQIRHLWSVRARPASAPHRCATG